MLSKLFTTEPGPLYSQSKMLTSSEYLSADGHAVWPWLCRLVGKGGGVNKYVDTVAEIVSVHCGRQLIIGYNEELGI